MLSKEVTVANHFFTLLGQLEEGCAEFSEFFQKPNGSKWRELMWNDAGSWADSIVLESGATKAVIIDEDYDYVLKIPFLMESGQNYCQIELENYVNAKQDNLEAYFAETFYLGEYEGAQCYASKKADCDDIEGRVSDEIRESYPDMSDEDFNSYIGDCWGEEIVEEAMKNCAGDNWGRLYDFLYDNGINDLHYGNIGYIDGSLVYIDFSGYREQQQMLILSFLFFRRGFGIFIRLAPSLY